MKSLIKYLQTAVFCCLASIACQKVEISDVPQVSQPAEDEFYTCVFELGYADAQTKSIIGETCVEWEDGDYIGVYMQTPDIISSNQSAPVYAATSTDPARIYIATSTDIPALVNLGIYAYHPYLSTNSSSPESVKVPLKSNQTGSDMMPMVSIPVEGAWNAEFSTEYIYSIGEETMKFCNLGSVMQLNVYSTNNAYVSEKIKSVSFQTIGGTPIAGNIVMDLTAVDYQQESTLAITFAEDEAVSDKVTRSVLPTLPVGSTKDAAAKVNLVIAPGSYSGTITVVTDKATYTKTFTSAKTFTRSRVKPLGLDLNIATRVENEVDDGTDPTDGKIMVLQESISESGIDVVFMGDAYTAEQIEEGYYISDIRKAADALFTIEPYKSYKDYFNVYAVTVVSNTDYTAATPDTALDTWFGEGTAVGGNNDKVIDYVSTVVANSLKMNEALAIVIMNKEYYAGTCYMYPSSLSNDWGSGFSISYFPLGTNDEMFAQLLHHEALGHGFAKLADEYYYEGTIPSAEVSEYQYEQEKGWWMNVDFTTSSSDILWAKFLTDEKYQYDGLGIYEGACTYMYGAYRPTDRSIMFANEGGFNAPSREAIYYRLNKLIFGSEWVYDYDDFVEYDAINRKTSSSSSVYNPNYVEAYLEPLAPPVVVRHSWDE